VSTAVERSTHTIEKVDDGIEIVLSLILAVIPIQDPEFNPSIKKSINHSSHSLSDVRTFSRIFPDHNLNV
jgi:hypothetical protein